jgi:hypothetical protein
MGRSSLFSYDYANIFSTLDLFRYTDSHQRVVLDATDTRALPGFF